MKKKKSKGWKKSRRRREAKREAGPLGVNRPKEKR